MKKLFRFLTSTVLIPAFFVNVLPCGPSYISPVFEYKYAPDNPYENFAAGKIGILKPSYRRIVLIASYRYLNGGSFNAEEQKALVDVWNAEFNNKSYDDNEVGDAVKKWVEKRKEVAEKDEKLPDIYTEREYGGYDFFPNCTKSSFETAADTLSNRMSSYGSDSKDVKNWARGQDRVFENCASGITSPEPPNEGMPEWLQKDRAYQMAAAAFYSLDYEEAKRRFAEIAQDSQSPWQETAEYLVGRTLIRQASLSKDEAKTNLLYIEAEQNLSLVVSKGGKFSDSANGLLGLVKYRLHPKERVGELARNLTVSGSRHFRQDLIDYNWLLDKFEKETLKAQEQIKHDASNKQKEEEMKEIQRNLNSNISNSANSLTKTISSNLNTNSYIEPPHDEGDLTITLYIEEPPQSVTFYLKPDATDEQAIAEAEKAIGRPLSDKLKDYVREQRRSAYTGRFAGNSPNEYEGGYYGEGKLSRSILPDFLRNDDLTDWLYVYQMQNTEAYLYSLSRFRQSGSDLWLATAISKADKNSSELIYLFDSANKTSRYSPAFPTIAFNQARILIEQGKTSEARKFLDEILNSTVEMPLSSRNQFQILRLKLSETLADFLKFAQLKPFTFDWDGQSGSIEDFIAEQKSWYSHENYPDQTREDYYNEVENNFKNEKQWQNRVMFDYETIELINQKFPIPVLLEAYKSPALPDYLRERFALAIWTRAALLGDYATAQKVAPDAVSFHPEFETLMNLILTAKTPIAKQNATLFFILKNPIVSPFLEDGLGKSDNEFGNFDANDWWCAPSSVAYDAETGEERPLASIKNPAFLSKAHSDLAELERKKLVDLGDAPTYFGKKVLEWQKRSPLDKRIPESLFRVYEANGWTKYGCGNNEELRGEIGNVLKKKYPYSEWTKKIVDEESGQK